MVVISSRQNSSISWMHGWLRIRIVTSEYESNPGAVHHSAPGFNIAHKHAYPYKSKVPRGSFTISYVQKKFLRKVSNYPLWIVIVCERGISDGLPGATPTTYAVRTPIILFLRSPDLFGKNSHRRYGPMQI